jgi:glycerol-3-phosphate acyltransferase PlsY
MEPIELVLTFLFPILGYFFGSINPGYFFGKAKGIDLREVGTKNAGASNTYRVLGLRYALPTVAFDTFKSLIVIYLALLSGVGVFISHLSGLMTIIGHIFPFYLSFNGGQGVASATGMLLFYILNYFIINPFFFFFMFYLLAIVLIFLYITRTGNLLGLMVLPLFGYAIHVYFPFNEFNIFCWIVIAHIITIGTYNIIDRGLVKIDDDDFNLHWWRVASRPFALILIFIYIFNQTISLMLIGGLALVFIIFDIYRLINKNIDEVLRTKAKWFLREREISRFSSMTFFLTAMFITMLVYNREISIIATTFLIFGDAFAKVFGLAFGRHKILNKTLEGSMAYLGGVIIMSYILYTQLEISLVVLFWGAISAPLIEIFSIGINDNFSVPILTGAIMSSLVFFGF